MLPYRVTELILILTDLQLTYLLTYSLECCYWRVAGSCNVDHVVSLVQMQSYIKVANTGYISTLVCILYVIILLSLTSIAPISPVVMLQV